LNLFELMRRPQTGQHLSSDQWSFMCTLKLSRLVNTLVHLMQSIGQRSFWIWFSYSLTAVFVVDSPPWLEEWLLWLVAGDTGGLTAMAAFERWSRVSREVSAGLGDILGAKIAAISAFFFWINPEREKGRLKSGKEG